jgi:hypothetical protein
MGWPAVLLDTVDTATLLYLLPLVIYVALTGLVPAVWWLFVVLWHVRPRPLGVFVTGAFVLAWVGVFVWVAPRVSRDSGQFDFGFTSLLVLASAYRLRSRLPRRRRGAGEPEDAVN